MTNTRKKPGRFHKITMCTGVVGDTWRIAVVVLAGLVLGLGFNAVHPMGLPLTLGNIKRPGIPVWVWKKFQMTKAGKAFKMLSQNENTVLVDVRDRKDYEKSHAKGAISLPYHEFEKVFPAFVARGLSDKRILIYCYGSGCGLSARVASRLLRRGYKNTIIIKKGFNAWKKANLPVEKAKAAQD